MNEVLAKDWPMLLGLAAAVILLIIGTIQNVRAVNRRERLIEENTMKFLEPDEIREIVAKHLGVETKQIRFSSNKYAGFLGVRIFSPDAPAEID